VVAALVDAARRGKDVRAVVELKARFDERRNAEWAQALEAAGARVMHAPAALKVHAKMLLIERREGSSVRREGSGVRREAHRLRRYAHVSSGNYNTSTATTYTDFALMTCDETIAADVAELFAFISGEVALPELHGVLAAPFDLRAGFTALVEREIAWAERGEAAQIILKMNSLLDPAAIDVLTRAAEAGVQVDLIVRGASALIPSNSRLRIRSIVGRFLEHSRAWYFRNGGAEQAFIGSADVRPRNFDTRLEVMVPVMDPALAARLRYEILDVYLLDTLSARALMPDGRYRRVTPHPGDPGIACQSALLDLRSSAADVTGPDDRHGHRASHLRRGHAGARALCVH
jgi:polyphosphate kinase